MAAQPIEGHELIRIIVDPHHLGFEFTDALLEISAPFTLYSGATIIEQFLPDEKKGDISRLWCLLEQKVAAFSWADEIKIMFETGHEIRIWPGSHRGTFISKVPPNVFEDF